MPELPEVETVRRGLEPVLLGARIGRVDLRRPDLRFPLPDRFSSRLAGRTVRGLRRRAKYLVAELDGPDALVMHLGMTGRFTVREAGQDADGEAGAAGGTTPGVFAHAAGGRGAHDHVVFHLDAEGGRGPARVTYNDARRFGFMDLVPSEAVEQSRHFRAMGVEPLGPDFTPERLASLFRGRRTPLKAALLDQRLVAGLGNIYVCEALHRARLSPERPAGEIVTATGAPSAAARRLAAEIRLVLEEALAAGGSSISDYARADGTLGAFQHRFRVYEREGEPCASPRCRGVVRRTVQAGRSTFHCATCQR